MYYIHIYIKSQNINDKDYNRHGFIPPTQISPLRPRFSIHSSLVFWLQSNDFSPQDSHSILSTTWLWHVLPRVIFSVHIYITLLLNYKLIEEITIWFVFAFLSKSLPLLCKWSINIFDRRKIVQFFLPGSG